MSNSENTMNSGPAAGSGVLFSENPPGLADPISRFAEYDDAGTIEVDKSELSTGLTGNSNRVASQVPTKSKGGVVDPFSIRYPLKVRMFVYVLALMSFFGIVALIVWYGGFLEVYRNSKDLHVDDELRAKTVVFDEYLTVGRGPGDRTLLSDPTLGASLVEVNSTFTNRITVLEVAAFSNDVSMSGMTIQSNLSSLSQIHGISLRIEDNIVAQSSVTILPNASIVSNGNLSVGGRLQASTLVVSSTAQFSGKVVLDNRFTATSLAAFGRLVLTGSVSSNRTVSSGLTTFTAPVANNGFSEFSGPFTKLFSTFFATDTLTSSSLSSSVSIIGRLFARSSPSPSLRITAPVFFEENSTSTSGKFDFLAETHVSGLAYVHGDAFASADTFWSGNATIYGAVCVNGSSSFFNKSMIEESLFAAQSVFVIGGNWTNIGRTIFKNDLQVDGNFSADGAINSSGYVLLKDAFVANGPVIVGSPFVVSGSSWFNGSTNASVVVVHGDFRSVGPAVFYAELDFSLVVNVSVGIVVDSNAIIAGPLFSKGMLSLTDASAKMDLTVNGSASWSSPAFFNQSVSFLSPVRVLETAVIHGDLLVNSSSWLSKSDVVILSGLQVAKKSYFQAAVNISAWLVVAEDAFINLDVSAGRNLSVSGTVKTLRDLKVGSAMTLLGAATFMSDVNILNSLNVSGVVIINGSWTSLSSFIVSGEGSLQRSSFQGPVHIDGGASFSDTSTVLVTAQTDVQGSTVFSSGSRLMGLSSRFYAAVSAQSSMTILRELTASGSVAFVDTAGLHSLEASSGAWIAGDLVVRGISNFSGPVVSAVAGFTAGMNVSGDAEFGGPVVFRSAVRASGPVRSLGAVRVDSMLTANAPASLSSTAVFVSPVTATFNVTCNGAVRVFSTGIAELRGETLIDSARPVLVRGSLDFYGPVTVSGTLSLSNSVTFSGSSVFVNYGSTTFSNPVTVNSVWNVSGATTVTGVALFSSSVSVSVSGTLTHTGGSAATFKDTVLFSNATSLQNAAIFRAGTTFGAAVSVTGNIDLNNDANFIGTFSSNTLGTVKFMYDVVFSGTSGPQFASDFLAVPSASLGRYDPRVVVSATNPYPYPFQCLQFKTTLSLPWFSSGSGCFYVMKRADLS
eukprot:ANDGO_07582.mRNA.1 hypothetical protein